MGLRRFSAAFLCLGMTGRDSEPARHPAGGGDVWAGPSPRRTPAAPVLKNTQRDRLATAPQRGHERTHGSNGAFFSAVIFFHRTFETGSVGNLLTHFYRRSFPFSAGPVDPNSWTSRMQEAHGRSKNTHSAGVLATPLSPSAAAQTPITNQLFPKKVRLLQRARGSSAAGRRLGAFP